MQAQHRNPRYLLELYSTAAEWLTRSRQAQVLNVQYMVIFVTVNVQNLVNVDIHRLIFETHFSLLGFNYLWEQIFSVLCKL